VDVPELGLVLWLVGLEQALKLVGVAESLIDFLAKPCGPSCRCAIDDD
jgi:hypothetical protein